MRRRRLGRTLSALSALVTSVALAGAALAGVALAGPTFAGAAAAKAPVRIKLVFDTSVSQPAAPDALPDEAQEKRAAPQPGEAAKGRGMWRGGAGSVDPRVMAAVSIPTEQTALVATVVFRVELTLLDGVERRRLTGEATGHPAESADAFDALAARGVPCLVVLAEIRNDAAEPLSFNPQDILLVTDRPDIVAPLDATRAWEDLREAGLPADMLLPDMQKVIYDTALLLKPGESVSRLLAYPLPKAGFRRARMDFSFFSVGPASFSFIVPMRPVAVEVSAPGVGESGP